MAGCIDANEHNPYLSYLKSKNKYESWMVCLASGMGYVDRIQILDITSSGDIRSWQAEVNTDSLSTEFGKAKVGGTRLIIFNPTNRLYMQDRAGIMYDIDPGFFRAVKMNCDHGLYNGINHRMPEFLAGGRPQYLDLGYGWAGIITHSDDNCNIVLVSAPYPLHIFIENYHVDGGDIYDERVAFSKEYLQALLKRDRDFFAEAHKDPLLLLLPILDIHVIYLYECLIHADHVQKAWSALRMMRHDGMVPLDCIQQYDSAHNEGKVQRSEEYKNLAKRFRCMEKQISLIEALARDYLQHHNGLFSLEESRASIKQSEMALEEGRRTKLITVLAIFFVPISLSTSIFGMNIHELNENGQSLWVFIVTTASIVAVAMMIWGFMYQFQKYNSLPRNNSRSEFKSWQTRLGHLLQLAFRGHIIWAWKSGILFSLLTDGRVAFLRSCTECDALPSPMGTKWSHDAHWPCAYIKAHLRQGSGFEYSKLEAMPKR
ncbi:hypothetical protein F5B20DRAFT_523670 [Whalleya microplaca]|nr:hypothetical protein F5B20DRAFT_523670 [Whalleya microplaca]